MEDLLKAVDSEKNKRFQKKWAKLEKGDKMNRIHLFIEEESVNKCLDDKKKKILEVILLDAFQKNNLSKSSDIEYCSDSAKITGIKNLNYDEEKKEYAFINKKKISKPSTKSKSNIERHFSRSKENRR